MSVNTTLDIFEVVPDLIMNNFLYGGKARDMYQHGTVLCSLPSAPSCGTAQNKGLNSLF